MAERIVQWMIVNLSGNFSPAVMVFIISLLPVLELRGGIIAAYALGMELGPAFAVAFIGNILPIPFILMFIRFILDKLRGTRLKGIVEKLEKKAMGKSGSIEKYAYWGLFAFVAIPLPGTGGWTGALIAALLDMDAKKSFLAILLGVLAAGIIVSALSYGLLDALRG